MAIGDFLQKHNASTSLQNEFTAICFEVMNGGTETGHDAGQPQQPQGEICQCCENDIVNNEMVNSGFPYCPKCGRKLSPVR